MARRCRTFGVIRGLIARIYGISIDGCQLIAKNLSIERTNQTVVWRYGSKIRRFKSMNSISITSQSRSLFVLAKRSAGADSMNGLAWRVALARYLEVGQMSMRELPMAAKLIEAPWWVAGGLAVTASVLPAVLMPDSAPAAWLSMLVTWAFVMLAALSYRRERRLVAAGRRVGNRGDLTWESILEDHQK